MTTRSRFFTRRTGWHRERASVRPDPVTRRRGGARRPSRPAPLADHENDGDRGRSHRARVDDPGARDAPELAPRWRPDEDNLSSERRALSVAIQCLTSPAVSGGVDVRLLGGIEWRERFRAAHPSVPEWFVEDQSDFTERFGSIDIPALVLSGDSDPISPVRVGEFLRDRLPSAQLEVISGAAHAMAHDEPDRIAPRIADFWRATARAASSGGRSEPTPTSRCCTFPAP